MEGTPVLPDPELLRLQRIRALSMQYSDMAENKSLHIDLLIAYSRRALLLGELAQAGYRAWKKNKLNTVQ